VYFCICLLPLSLFSCSFIFYVLVFLLVLVVTPCIVPSFRCKSMSHGSTQLSHWLIGVDVRFSMRISL
jgi:hypothetical protein